MSAIRSGGESGHSACFPMQGRVISKVPATSDTTCSWRCDPGTCLVLEEVEGDPVMGSSLGSVNNLFCVSEQDIRFIPGSV